MGTRFNWSIYQDEGFGREAVLKAVAGSKETAVKWIRRQHAWKETQALPGERPPLYPFHVSRTKIITERKI